MCFIDTFLRRLTAYREESCLQKYAGCQSAFSQLLFSTRTLPSFSATYILASTCSLFFFIYFIPFCSHCCPLCPVSAQLPGIASAAAEPIQHPLKASAPAESICAARGPPLLLPTESRHGPHHTIACREKPKVPSQTQNPKYQNPNRDHHKSLPGSEGSIRSICSVSAPGCSP